MISAICYAEQIFYPIKGAQIYIPCFVEELLEAQANNSERRLLDTRGFVKGFGIDRLYFLINHHSFGQLRWGFSPYLKITKTNTFSEL